MTENLMNDLSFCMPMYTNFDLIPEFSYPIDITCTNALTI